MVEITGEMVEGGTAVLLARVLGVDGDPIVQADVSTITLDSWQINPPLGEVFPIPAVDTNLPKRIGTVGTLTISQVVYDTLQTDDRWTADAVGYNLAVECGADRFPASTKATYASKLFGRVYVTITLTSGKAIVVEGKMTVSPSLVGKN